jgi:hypothetical protein
MAITLPYKQPRGTRAALNALAGSSAIIPGLIYHLTDENRIALGLTSTTYEVYSKLSEVTSLKTGSLPVVIDGGGVVIAANQNVIVPHFPFDATITGWTIAGDLSTTSVITVSKATYANYPTFTDISGTEKPTITATTKNQDLTLTTWTTSISAGDFLKFNVDSNNNDKQLFLGLLYTRV